MTESKLVEYKLNVSASFEKEVVAFLNSSTGGKIYFGINDDGENIGLENADRVQLQIKDKLKNNILPSCMGLFDISLVSNNNKNIIELTLASGREKPYYIRRYGLSPKGCFIRVGSASEPMDVNQIEDMFSRRTRVSIGKIKSNKQDLSFEQLKIYYEEFNRTLNDQFASNLELLTEKGAFNYGAYLLSDVNGTSIKVAKYEGTNRVILIENEEYGYCSLIKAAKQALAKLELENKTYSRITSSGRIDIKLWDGVAIREAVINAIVHNDYIREIPPKFELFSDRLEITSAGGLSFGLDKETFFDGYSVPVNREIMRVFKDLGMVEQLGSGLPRILKVYQKDSFIFNKNFIRMVFLFPKEATDQAILAFCRQPKTTQELMVFMGMKHKTYFRNSILKPLLESGQLVLTIPHKPKSPNQKYKSVNE